MSFPLTHIKGLMVTSGLLTCTMATAALAPRAALLSTFGEDLGGGGLAEIVVRNWGVLITLVGAALIYGAYRPAARTLALVLATASKLAFVFLILSLGPQYLAAQAGVAVGIDAVWVGLFGWYLVMAHRRAGKSNAALEDSAQLRGDAAT